jgi:hypothetical protein
VGIEYVDPTRVVKAPRKETVVEKLRRPKTKFEADLFAKDLGAALDRLGVERGAEFVIAAGGQGEVAIASLAEVSAPARGAVRNTDPSTSAKAADDVLPRSGTQRRAVVDALYEAGDGGLISDELAQITGIDYRSVTPRIGELKNLGWVFATSRTRKSTKNADSEVLVLTRKAREALAPSQEPAHTQGRLVSLDPGSAILGG